jgi:Rps23 Pro-64 3,4-dihydroxylase Tpa1-like proline 4-hydroxylase
MPVVVIDDYYDNYEYSKIWQELKFLSNDDKKLKDPMHLSSAIVNGNILKHADGLILDSVYKDRSVSNILTENRKIFSSEVISNLIRIHPFFSYYSSANFDITKMHYYSDGDYYDYHKDIAIITAVSWFFKSPKMFTDGDLLFESGPRIECLNNRTVIFPSFLRHSVTKLRMLEQDRGQDGRYAITQLTFING